MLCIRSRLSILIRFRSTRSTISMPSHVFVFSFLWHSLALVPVVHAYSSLLSPWPWVQVNMLQYFHPYILLWQVCIHARLRNIDTVSSGDYLLLVSARRTHPIQVGRTDRVGRRWKQKWDHLHVESRRRITGYKKISKAVETKGKRIQTAKKQNDKKDKGRRLAGSSSRI